MKAFESIVHIIVMSIIIDAHVAAIVCVVVGVVVVMRSRGFRTFGVAALERVRAGSSQKGER